MAWNGADRLLFLLRNLTQDYFSHSVLSAFWGSNVTNRTLFSDPLGPSCGVLVSGLSLGFWGFQTFSEPLRNFEGCICVPVWGSNRLERNVLVPEGRAQGNTVEADLLLALDAAKIELRMQAPQLLKAWSSQLDTGAL